jgi:hypothetical protein
MRWRGAVLGLAAGALLAAPAAAGQAEDDLAIVKKAVQDRAPAAASARRDLGARPGRAEWLKVRIVEKEGRKARVSVNLPLALVRTLGDEVQLDGRCARRAKCGITLGEVLDALEAGQRIVEIEAEDGASVRVWVE